MQRVRWSASEAADVGSRELSDLLEEYVAAYLARGDAALMDYHDDPAPMSMRYSLARLLSRFTALHELTPELADHLRAFPETTNGVEDLVYWQREKFWRKQVLSLNHRSLLERDDRVLSATKQLWASHFFESNLSVLVVVPDAGGSSCIFANHARADIR